jgi:hypothetical protein
MTRTLIQIFFINKNLGELNSETHYGQAGLKVQKAPTDRLYTNEVLTPYNCIILSITSFIDKVRLEYTKGVIFTPKWLYQTKPTGAVQNSNIVSDPNQSQFPIVCSIFQKKFSHSVSSCIVALYSLTRRNCRINMLE